MTVAVNVLRPKEAAVFLGVSVSHLAKLRCWGGGPIFCKVGTRGVGYRIEDLKIWLDKRCYPDTSRVQHGQ